jgi:hypothetical protein
MKTKIEFYQSETNYSFESEIENSVNLFTGTALNQLFRYVNVAKSVGAKTFSFKEPINLRITAEDVKYDTGVCSQALQAKLKMQRNDKGMLRFGKRVFELVKWSTSEVQVLSINEVLEDLE